MDDILKIKIIGGGIMGIVHATASGIASMIELTEEQQQEVKKWVEEARQTVEKTALEEGARVSIDESIKEIEPVLERFMSAVNITIRNYEDAGEGLKRTISNIEDSRV